MKIFSRIVLILVSVAVLSWFLPWLYALATPSPAGSPFCAFSPVNGKWIVSRSAPGEKPVIRILDSVAADGSIRGAEITREERDSLVPQMFYKELLAHDALPESIAGKAVSAHELRTHELMLNASSRDVVKAQPGVWMMMESMPVRVDLSDADQVFRFPAEGGIEFVDMATNEVNPTRSARFTKAMERRGFKFPGRDFSANVTSRKAYDEGYLMIDDADKVYHVKQRAGRPYVAPVAMPGGVKASKGFILEEMNRDILGFIIDTENNAYFLEREGYSVMPLPVGKIDPRKENILVMGNLFNFTFRITRGDTTRWIAVERTPEGYSLLGEYTYVAPRTTASVVADYIFPYVLSFTSTSDSLAYPRLGRWSARALWLNIVLALVLAFAVRRRRGALAWSGVVLTLVCGVYAFIPFIVLRD